MAPNLSNPFRLFFLLLLVLVRYSDSEEIREEKKTSNFVDYSLKSIEKPIKGKLDMRTIIPKIPKHIQVYIAVAFSEKDFPSYSKIFNRTLSNLPSSFLITDSLKRNYNVSISPLFFVLPASGRFSSSIYEVMCSSFPGKRIVTILIIGENPAAFTVSMAAYSSNIPVLWATGGLSNPPGSLQQYNPLEIRLESGESEFLEAIRSIFLATHWHSFTVMAAPSIVTRWASILNVSPLNPKVVPISKNSNKMFGKMADVSRSTRGVVLLLCDLPDAILVMDMAKKLNMIDGHFVWIWIDTKAKPAAFLIPPPPPSNENFTDKITKFLDKSSETKNTKSESSYQSESPRVLPNFTYLQNKFQNKKHNEAASQGAKKFKKREANLKVDSKGFEPKIGEQRFENRNEPNEIVEKEKNGQESLSKNDDNKNTKNNNNKNNNPGVAKQKVSPTLKPLDFEKINAQKSKSFEKRQSTEPFDVKTKEEAKNWEEFASLDYLNDFEVQQDSAELRETEDLVMYAPASKTWGKVTDHFPLHSSKKNNEDESDLKDTNLPIGLLSVKPEPMKLDRHLIKGSVRLLVSSFHRALKKSANWLNVLDSVSSCWTEPSPMNKNFSTTYAKEIRRSVKDALAGKLQFQEKDKADRSLMANFQILNLVPEKFNVNFYNNANVIKEAILYWRQVGRVMGRTAQLNTIVWPGGDVVASALSGRTRSVFRIVTALAPPFVMEGALDENRQCLRGIICHRVLSSDKDNLTLVFNEMDMQERMEDEFEELGGNDRTEKPSKYLDDNYLEYHSTKRNYTSSCCYGLSMDLLKNVAQELEFEFRLYIVPDGFYGAKTHVWGKGGSQTKWNGIVGDLVSGAAHMSFTALSVTKQRSQVVDFSTPYFYGGVSFLTSTSQKSGVPLLAFLQPFSMELWIAIFTFISITALAVACYEWLSPFGLNPRGRQRSRNFNIGSALWALWGLLCGHLFSFKVPKSWPNKFLINIWGGFSVIFVASYTANFAGLIAGFFFHDSVSDYHDRSLLTQRVGAPKSSSADYYIHRVNQHLWEHMQKYSFKDVETGITMLRNGSLDIIIADTPILDYYRATDNGCKLQKIIDAINEDSYAIGMNKGFPLKESISAVISKYSNNGYMDILKEKWYGSLPCFKMTPSAEMTDGQPHPLGISAVAGVFLLLGLGMVTGFLILIFEHLFYRYILPLLRRQPRGTVWRSRDVMFVSQKLYRFINCVELVSPHHAARELVHTLRQGQITSLFQKSVKRKDRVRRRRRPSSPQVFEMVEEDMRRAQQGDREEPNPVQNISEPIASTSKDRSFLNSPRPFKQYCGCKSSGSSKFFSMAGQSKRSQSRAQRKTRSILNFKRLSRGLFSLTRSAKPPMPKSRYVLDYERFTAEMRERRRRAAAGPSNTYEFRLSAKEIRKRSSSVIGRRLGCKISWLIESPPDWKWRNRPYSVNLEIAKALGLCEHLYTQRPQNSPLPSYLGECRYAGPATGISSAYMNDSPDICKEANSRLAASGGASCSRSPALRPRFPSPQSSSMGFRPPVPPRLSSSDEESSGDINDDADTVRNFDPVYPKYNPYRKKSSGTFRIQSTSLENERLSAERAHRASKQPDILNQPTVSYASLDHNTDNFDDVGISRVIEKLESLKISRETQTSPEEKDLYGKKSYRSPAGTDKSPKRDYIPSSSIGVKETEIYSSDPDLSDSQTMYTLPVKPRREKRGDKSSKKQKEEPIDHPTGARPKVYTKHVSKHKSRSSSTPEKKHKSPITAHPPCDIPEPRIPYDCDYCSDYNQFQKSESFSDRCEELRNMERSYETYPVDRRCGSSHEEPYYHRHSHHYPPRGEPEGEFEMVERGGDLPGRRYVAPAPEKRRGQRRLPEIPKPNVIYGTENFDEYGPSTSQAPDVLRHHRCGIRDEVDYLPPPPPPPYSPISRRRRYERREAEMREMYSFRRGTRGYLDRSPDVKKYDEFNF